MIMCRQPQSRSSCNCGAASETSQCQNCGKKIKGRDSSSIFINSQDDCIIMYCPCLMYCIFGSIQVGVNFC